MKTHSLVIALLVVLLPAAPSVQAQGRERREMERREHERFQTDHWVFDERFHHNHYYPAPGYALRVLPAGNIVVTFGNRRFFFQSGVWYQPGPAGYLVIRPPLGIVVPVLPSATTMVWAGGAPYYYANDVYYVPAPGGFMVTAPPMAAGAQPPIAPSTPAQAPQMPPMAPPPAAPPLPQQAAPAPTSYYYCESSKAYYPYVPECREGWRQVPATPPR